MAFHQVVPTCNWLTMQSWLLSGSLDQIIWASVWFWKAWIVREEWIYFLYPLHFVLCRQNQNTHLKSIQKCNTHTIIHLYTFTLEFESTLPLFLGSYWKKWIRKLKIRKDRIKVCENQGVCWRSSVFCGWGEGIHLATTDSTVVSQNPGGRLQEGDGKFLFLLFAHSAFISLRDRKLISSYRVGFFFFFPLQLPVLFRSCCSSGSLEAERRRRP